MFGFVIGGLAAAIGGYMAGRSSSRDTSPPPPPPPPQLRTMTDAIAMAGSPPAMQSLRNLQLPDFASNFVDYVNGIEQIKIYREGNKRYLNGKVIVRKINETEEEKKLRDELKTQYLQNISKMSNLATQYGDLTNGNTYFRYMMGVANALGSKISAEQYDGQERADFLRSMDSIRNYTEGRINDYYNEAQRALDNKLGAEGRNSSIGIWQQAQLDNQRRKDLMDNEFYWLTEGRGKMAQADLLENEAKYRPLAYKQQMLMNANTGYENAEAIEANKMNSFQQGLEQHNRWNQQDYTNRFTAMQTDNANAKDLYSLRIGNAIDMVNSDNATMINAYNAQNNANLQAEQIRQMQHQRSFTGQIAPVLGNLTSAMAYGWARNGFKKFW